MSTDPLTPEQIKSLLENLKTSIETVNGYWTLYSTVAFALLGYVFAAEGPIKYPAVRWMLALVFAVYAVCNWSALTREQNKAFAVAKYTVAELKKHPETRSLANAFRKNKPAKSVTLLHVVLDIAVITLILSAPAIKRSKPVPENS